MQFEVPKAQENGFVPRLQLNKNRRRNTSCLVRYAHSDGSLRNILVDCGKTFYESALLVFTQYRLRRIDGVLLTHAHADAMLGLDDLRQWTMNGRVQEAIDIYLSKETMERVEACFPYMVSKDRATGGGEVATLKFHIFDAQGLPDSFLVDELQVIPIPVEHGKYSDGNTFYCMGFRFEDFTYISDTNHVPPESVNKIIGSTVLVIDALKPDEHASHFSYDQAMDFCCDILPVGGRGLLTGLCHVETHESVEERIRKHRGIPKKKLDVQVAFDTMRIFL